MEKSKVQSLLGTWQYSEKGIYDIIVTDDGLLLFKQHLMTQQVLSGNLKWRSPWGQAKVYCDGEPRGDVRVRSIRTRDIVISNFRPEGTKEFGGDNIAKRTSKPEESPCTEHSADVPDCK